MRLTLQRSCNEQWKLWARSGPQRKTTTGAKALSCGARRGPEGPLFHGRVVCRSTDQAVHKLIARFGERKLRIDLNLGHHATVFVIQNVAVIDERSGNVRIAEVHAHGDARIRA